MRVFFYVYSIHIVSNGVVNMTQIASLINGMVTNMHLARTSSGASSSGQLVELDKGGHIDLTMLSPDSSVLSFNSRTGNVALQSSDIASALQFTPLNPYDLIVGTFDATLNTLTINSTFTQSISAGANNQTPMLHYGDVFTDMVVTGLVTTTSSTTSGTLSSGVAYVKGQRVIYNGGTYTVGESTTSYLDLSTTGIITVSTSTVVTPNCLRLWAITSSTTAITSVAIQTRDVPTIKLNNYSGSNKTTTGSIASGSVNLTLSSPIDFSNGQGITIGGAGAAGADLTAAQIISGGGTTNLVINIAASTSVSNAIIYHDDTAAIQAALDAAAPIAGEVNLPASTPQISSTLYIGSGVSLKGESIQGTQIQSYLTSNSAVPTFDNWMIQGIDCTNPLLSNFSIRGPGINGYNGSGISFNLVNNGDITGAAFVNLLIIGFPGSGLYMDAPVASIFHNVMIQDFGGNGFQLYGGTSCEMAGCYALTGVGNGYMLQSMTYCSINGCASEGCGINYYFLNSNNIALNGSGSEEAQYRKSTNTGIHFGFDNSTGIVINGGYARGFAIDIDGADINQYLNLVNGSQVCLTGFRGRSSTSSPNLTYSIDSTSTLRLIDSQFDGPNNTLSLVSSGGSLVIESSTQTTLSGPTSGSIIYAMPEQGNFKKFKAITTTYQNNSTTNQIITFPTPFTNIPWITTNVTGLSLIVSTTELTIVAPNTTELYSGIIIIEGS